MRSRRAACVAGALLACSQLGAVRGADDPSLLCACPGLVWSVKPQGNKVTDDIHNANVQALQLREANGGLDLAFYGDSITQHINSGDNIAAFLKAWGKYKALAMGVGNDRVYNLFWRLKNGELPATPLKVAVFLIGTNDVGYTEECTRNEQDLLLAVPSINSRLRHMIEWVSQAQPKLQIVLLGVLPRGGWTLDVPSAWPNRMTSTINAINAGLQTLAAEDPLRHYVDCGAFALVNGTGPINTELLPDSLHPNIDGYADLFACLQPLVSRLMIAEGASVSDGVPLTNSSNTVQLEATSGSRAGGRVGPVLLESDALRLAASKPMDAPLTNSGRQQAAVLALDEEAGRQTRVAAASIPQGAAAAPRAALSRAFPFAAPSPRSNLGAAAWQRLVTIIDNLPTRPANASDPNDICLRSPPSFATSGSASAQAFSQRMAASQLLNERNTPQPGCDFCPPA